ncbi:nickel-dependent hydrogenase large subunit [Motiliproteus sp. MSK22-1]|uniref:nickel-dependent hydrogenase large subunit n=1 Tax=Motiliproteus sp. MSK22-1 TaxID=1897630 RepID=UPI0009780647|nr:nickel-dependent hydrogenase large subunit [Motiliproteus sp. MSK22-1]OMH32118.1 hypothetical protein BGP75_15585 [Motiliproteus sp. MSK22-1]
MIKLENKIVISGTYCAPEITDLTIDIQRPQWSQRLLVSCSPEDAVSRLEQLYVVCRQSQKTAAMLALGIEQQTVLARQRVVLETIEQLLWRMAIDLPHFLALGSGAEPFSLIRRYISCQLAAEEMSWNRCNELVQTLAAFFKLMLGCSVCELLCFDRDQFNRWLNQSQAMLAVCLRQVKAVAYAKQTKASYRLMPTNVVEAQGEQLLHSILTGTGGADRSFCQQPLLKGKPIETGPLAYMQQQPLIQQMIEFNDHPLVVRYSARLLYLATLIDSQRIMEPQGIAGVYSAPCSGAETDRAVNGTDSTSIKKDSLTAGQHYRMSWVNSVRGLLLHVAAVKNGSVVDYRICAPTEWNFHPEGALSQLVTGLTGAKVVTLKSAIELSALAFDPCVPFAVDLVEAENEGRLTNDFIRRNTEKTVSQEKMNEDSDA